MAIAADFDSDGQTELLLPNQQRTELGAIQRTVDGATVAWALSVDGIVASNLAAIRNAHGSLAVGVGRTDGVLRIWQQAN